MRPLHISQLLDAIIKSPTSEGVRKDSVLIIGKPGGGKTSLCKQAAMRNNHFLICFQPNFHEPVDLSGVPYIMDGKTLWAPPGWVPGKIPDGFDGILMLIDEMTQCDPPMIKACAPIVEEHRIGATFLPQGSIVVATGNRAGDRAGAHKLLTHVKSRVCEIPFEDSLDDFEDWGISTGNIIPEVRYYLRWKPASINNFDPASEQQYASQRGWAKVSKMYPILPEHLRHQTVTGLIGAAGNEFMAFAKVWEELTNTYDVTKILAAPDKAPLPKRDQVDILWSLVGSIAEHVKTKGIKEWEAACRYFQRMPSREFLFIGVQHTMVKVPKEKRAQIYASKEFQKFMTENRDLLNEASSIK